MQQISRTSCAAQFITKLRGTRKIWRGVRSHSVSFFHCMVETSEPWEKCSQGRAQTIAKLLIQLEAKSNRSQILTQFEINISAKSRQSKKGRANGCS
jgi:hypothetical protein